MSGLAARARARHRNPDGELYDAMIAVAERRMDEIGLAATLRGTSSSVVGS